MNLDEKLRQLKQAANKQRGDLDLERALQHLRRLRQSPRKLPAQRMPKGINEYVEGETKTNDWGQFFLARQELPFGRPYGRLRVGDIAGADLSPLDLFLPGVSLPQAERIVFLDTETTGLAGGTGTCAFLIGIGTIEGSKFVIRQFFLRDYPEEKAALAALVEALKAYGGVVTFNGKTFDVPLLETRYALARLNSPFVPLVHFDALHPARRLWRLRLESCELTRLEREVLGISRKGEVPGSDIPEIYFDYLRTGDARGLQPVFYHNSLDIITLAALTVELARAVGHSDAELDAPSIDLFSLSRIFDRAGAGEKSVSTCQQALAAGLPESVEAMALWHLACQYKRQRKREGAAEIWLELTRRKSGFTVKAFEELAIYYEHHRRDFMTALAFTEAAAERLSEDSASPVNVGRFTRRLERLRRKSTRTVRALPSQG